VLDVTRLRDDTGYDPVRDTERAAADHITRLRARNGALNGERQSPEAPCLSLKGPGFSGRSDDVHD
jgi:hypothetical protein